MAEKKSVLDVLRIALVLFLICTIVASLVSAVHALTYETYQANVLEQKQRAIAALFDLETVECERLTTHPDAATMDIYSVFGNGVLLGYCANVQSAGFGGDIDMMVAVTPHGEVIGVEIVSMSETPGLGSRVGEADYLSQYIGVSTIDSVLLGDGLTIGEEVDAISGATISSKAVLAGVNAALDALLSCLEEKQ